MRQFVHDHPALSVFAPTWLLLTIVVYACCGLGR